MTKTHQPYVSYRMMEKENKIFFKISLRPKNGSLEVNAIIFHKFCFEKEKRKKLVPKMILMEKLETFEEALKTTNGRAMCICSSQISSVRSFLLRCDTCRLPLQVLDCSFCEFSQCHVTSQNFMMAICMVQVQTDPSLGYLILNN